MIGRRAASLAVAVGVASVTVAGCGVPEQTRADVFAQKDIPFGLAESPGTSATTDTGVVAGESVPLYFFAGDHFITLDRDLERPVELSEVVGALAEGPRSGEAGNGARSVIGADDVVKVVLRGGVANVDLAPRFRELPSREQLLALAQLVLTLTERPGVGQVAFTVGEEPTDVPTASGNLSKTAVSRDDYDELLTPPTSTTTTTTIIVPAPSVPTATEGRTAGSA